MSDNPYRRAGIIVNLKKATGCISDNRLLDHLQLECAPTCVSDCAISLDDVPAEDLRDALRAIVGH